MKKLFVICVLSLMTALAWGQSDVVKVECGQVQGVASASSDVTVFRGIPYAAPPVGDLRWKRPQPVVKWKGVRKADTFSNICWQPGNANSIGAGEGGVSGMVTIDSVENPTVPH